MRLIAQALAGLVLILVAFVAVPAYACNVQLGKPNSCYTKNQDGRTFYGPGSGVRGEIYNLGGRLQSEQRYGAMPHRGGSAWYAAQQQRFAPEPLVPTCPQGGRLVQIQGQFFCAH